MECYFVVNNKSFYVLFKGIFIGIKIFFYVFCSYFIFRKLIDERSDYYFKID